MTDCCNNPDLRQELEQGTRFVTDLLGDHTGYLHTPEFLGLNRRVPDSVKYLLCNPNLC